MPRKVKNITASVRARLLAIAKASNRDFNAVLLQYFQERFLYRLSLSPHKSRYILKGALLFLSYGMPRSRPTRDIDPLGTDSGYIRQELESDIRAILSIEADDGVVFCPERIESELINENTNNKGFRIHCESQLERIKMRFHIDIGFGDQITPHPISVDFPTLLDDMPVPNIIAYTPESAIAEKFEAIVKLGYITSRMKDFYDIIYLAENYRFESDILLEAISNTFRIRQTDMSDRQQIFSEAYSHDKNKQTQWSAFISKNDFDIEMNFAACIGYIRNFLEPVLSGEIGHSIWDIPGKKWIPAVR